MRTSKQLLFIASFLISTTFAFSQTIDWQIHQGQGAGIFVPGPGDPSIQEILDELVGPGLPIHGDPGGFQYADIPPANDAGWDVAPIDEDGDLCWRLDRSRLNGFMTALDFTYFQTSVFVEDASLPFILRFYQVDDGARAYVFNSANPTGAFIPGGDARLFAPIAATDISPLFVEGEENRIVIVQFDDSDTQNYLKVEVIGGEGIGTDECEGFVTVTANDDSFSTDLGESITFTDEDLLGNDSASDGSALEVQNLALTNPDDGELVNNNDGSYTFTPAEGFSGDVSLSYTAKVIDSPSLFGENGHYYSYVDANRITWTAARDAAAISTLNGVSGYLATVTSEAENNFITSVIGGFAWLGGSDGDEEGVWEWVTGPEAGTQFWQGGADGNIVDGLYANWVDANPNNSNNNEDFVHTSPGSGLWNDWPNSIQFINGYVVEFDGVEGCETTFSDDAVVTITVTENIDECEDDTEAPTIASYSVGTFIDGEQDGTFSIDLIEGEVNVLEVGCGLSRFNSFGIGSSTSVDDNCSDLFGIDTEIEEISRNTLEDGSLEIIETYTVSDESGNSRQYTISTIYLSDTETPQFQGCPADVVSIQLNESGTAAPSLEDLGISVTDNCSTTAESLTLTFEPEVITAETQECVITATDAEGNSTECRFPVNPIGGDPCANGNDNEDPVIDGCPGDIVIVELDTNGEAFPPSLDSLGISISDNCGSLENGDLAIFFDPPVITANTQICVITVIDSNGNEAECAFPVEPIGGDPCANGNDNEDPVIDGCPGDVVIVELDANGEAFPPSLDSLGISISDNCGSLENGDLTITFEPEVITANTQICVIRVVDANGNEAECAFPVEPISGDPCANDTEAPRVVLTVRATRDGEPIAEDIFEVTDGGDNNFILIGACGSSARQIVFGTADNCSSEAFLQDNLDFRITDERTLEDGSTELIYVFDLVDEAGNRLQEEVSIILEGDSEAPRVVLTVRATLDGEAVAEDVFEVTSGGDNNFVLPGACSAARQLVFGTADNCSSEAFLQENLEIRITDERTLEDGSTELIYVFGLVDEAGNSLQEEVSIILEIDKQPPVIIDCPPSDELYFVAVDSAFNVISGQEEILADFVGEDNCGTDFTLNFEIVLIDLDGEPSDSITISAIAFLVDEAGNVSEEGCEVLLRSVDVSGANNQAFVSKENAIESRSNFEEKMEVNIHPNPFYTQANLQVKLPQEEMVNIDMRDISGRMVKSMSLQGSVGENTFYLQRDGLATGVYFISVRTASTQQTVKVVVTQ